MALERRDWPESDLVQTSGPMGWKLSRAAWKVASRQIPVPRDDAGAAQTIWIYLLSNGKFTYGGSGNPAQTADRVVQVSKEDILAGLQRLLRRYS